MKKLLLTLVVLVGGGLAVAVFSINSLVKSGIEKFGPEILNTSVSVGSANISLLSGEGSISNLVIGSPDGFKSDQTFKLTDVSLKLDPNSLLSDTIIINSIVVDGPDVTYEVNEKGMNVNKLLNNSRKAKNVAATRDSQGDDSGKPSKKVVIEDLRIKNGKVTLAAGLLGQGTSASSPLPDIQINDIGKKGNGTSFSSAIAKVLTTVSSKVATAGININTGNIKEAADGVKDTLDGVGDSLKNLF